MALAVIGAGLGRTATLTMKFALEHLGFGPCFHMAENFANARRTIPLWLDAIAGKPDWDAIFEGYRSTTDYPACTYWRELAEFYPEAKVVLTTRDADSWFESVSETIFSEAMQGQFRGTPIGAMMQGVIFDHFDGDITDRAFMTEWFERRNQEIIDTIPAERLLVFHPREGWEPLCEFLDVPVPAEKLPRVNSRDELMDANEEGAFPSDPAEAERSVRAHLDQLKALAFS